MGMRLTMVIGAWCAAFFLCAQDLAFAQCGSLDGFCGRAGANPFDTPASLGGESARDGVARPVIRRKVKRVAPTPQAQPVQVVQVAATAPKGTSREALYQRCKTALFNKYAFTGIYDGRVARLMYADRLGQQIDSCVANGGNPI
jgi:hypothetical protein